MEFYKQFWHLLCHYIGHYANHSVVLVRLDDGWAWCHYGGVDYRGHIHSISGREYGRNRLGHSCSWRSLFLGVHDRTSGIRALLLLVYRVVQFVGSSCADRYVLCAALLQQPVSQLESQ